MHVTPVLLNFVHLTIFWTDQILSLFASFQKNFFHLKKCLCHVYVYAIVLTWTEHI